MDSLKELNINCFVCNKKAIYVIESEDPNLGIPLCGNCARASVIGRSLRVKTLPSHEPITFQRANKFPPEDRQWFRSIDNSITIGCPKCHNIVGLTNIHQINKVGGLEPSFICPKCGLHSWLTFDEWEV